MRMFGITRDGNSVCCHVHGFSPYFYVNLPTTFTETDLAPFKVINFYLKNHTVSKAFSSSENSRHRQMIHFKDSLSNVATINFCHPNALILPYLLITVVNKLNILHIRLKKSIIFVDTERNYQITLPITERTAWIWLLMFAYFVPEAGTLFRSVRILLFKTWTFPKIWDFISVLITESMPAIGSSILVFAILPELDVVKGAMLTNAVCFVPAVGKFTI